MSPVGKFTAALTALVVGMVVINEALGSSRIFIVVYALLAVAVLWWCFRCPSCRSPIVTYALRLNSKAKKVLCPKCGYDLAKRPGTAKTHFDV
jgi:transposase-like protein